MSSTPITTQPSGTTTEPDSINGDQSCDLGPMATLVGATMEPGAEGESVEDMTKKETSFVCVYYTMYI